MKVFIVAFIIDCICCSIFIESGKSIYDSPCLKFYLWHLQYNKWTQSNLKSLPLMKVFNPIWYLERSHWKRSSIISSVLSLIVIKMLSHFEHIRRFLSLSLEYNISAPPTITYSYWLLYSTSFSCWNRFLVRLITLPLNASFSFFSLERFLLFSIISSFIFFPLQILNSWSIHIAKKTIDFLKIRIDYNSFKKLCKKIILQVIQMV